MTEVVGVLISVIAVILGWALNLNSKVNVQEARREDLLKLIEVRFDSIEAKVDARFDSSNQRLERIERALNGSFPHRE